MGKVNVVISCLSKTLLILIIILGIIFIFNIIVELIKANKKTSTIDDDANEMYEYLVKMYNTLDDDDKKEVEKLMMNIKKNMNKILKLIERKDK